MMTRYHEGTEERALTVDSDLPDNLGITEHYPIIGREAFVAEEGTGADGAPLTTPKRYLGQRQEMLEGQIILAAQGKDRSATAQETIAATDFQNDLDGRLTFDWMDARDYAAGDDAVKAGDVGELPPPTQDIVGIFWNDADNDGVQTIDELTGDPVLYGPADENGARERVVIDYATGDNMHADNATPLPDVSGDGGDASSDGGGTGTKGSADGGTALSDSGAATEKGTTEYVLNTNSKKFHVPSCSSVDQMSAKNRQDVTDTRENIVGRGFEPCKRCNP